MLNSEWQKGWQLYANGYSVEWCRTESEQRGWWAANRAQGWAEVNA